MKNILSALTIAVIAIFLAPSPATAATPDEETAFVAAYKKAFEAGDEKALKAFFYTEGADPEIAGMMTMMMTSDMGKKISSIELVALTPEEIKDAEGTKPLPNGKNAKLPLKPYKKLVIKIETKDENGSSSSSSTSLVAEKDGKLVIPFPVVVK